MIYHWWHGVLGIVALTGLGFLFREALVGAAQALGGWAIDRLKAWKEKQDKKKTPVYTNEDLKPVQTGYCKLKHENIEKDIAEIKETITTNNLFFVKGFKEFKEETNDKIQGIREVSDRNLEAQSKINFKLGLIMGHLGIKEQ